MAPQPHFSPQHDQVCVTDEDGRFSVPGVPKEQGTIAVYDRHRLSASGPFLLSCRVPSGCSDIGTLRLAQDSDAVIRVVDAAGNPARAARLRWCPAGQYIWASTSVLSDEQSIVNLEHVPGGTPIDVLATIHDARHGQIRQLFRMESLLAGETILRVDGAGWVVLRFWEQEDRSQPRGVRFVNVELSEGEALMMPLPRMPVVGGWVAPGDYEHVRVVADEHECDLGAGPRSR